MAEGAVRLASAMVLWSPLAHLLEVDEETPLIDLQGQQLGALRVRVGIESIGGRKLARDQGEETGVLEESKGDWSGAEFTKRLGQEMVLEVVLSDISGLSPAVDPSSVEVRYKLTLDGMARTDPVRLSGERASGVNVKLLPTTVSKKPVTLTLSTDLREAMLTETMQFELWGERSDAANGADASKQMELEAVAAERDRLKKQVAELEEAKNKKSGACSIL